MGAQDDLGFACRELVAQFHEDKRAAKAQALRALVPVVVGRLTALQNLVSQSIQHVGSEGPVSAGSIGLISDYRKSIIAYRAIGRIGCDDVSNHELLQSVDAILQFLELVLIERSHRGESPELGGPVLPTLTPNTPHCLSETPE